MRLVDCIVTYSLRVHPEYHILRFKCDRFNTIMPGQFITIAVNGLETILRRPFTIYRYFENTGEFEILFKIKGKGTRILSGIKEGEYVNVLGPLGKGFPLYKNVVAVLLSRGVGLASLTLLGSRLHDLGSRVITITSFKDRKSNLITGSDYIGSYIKSFSDDIITVYDEDNTSDVKNVARLLNEIKPDVVYTCGSKRLVKLLKELPYKAYVSWEELMGCGIGACLSCVVRTISGYKLTCQDGPVFDVKEIIL